MSIDPGSPREVVVVVVSNGLLPCATSRVGGCCCCCLCLVLPGRRWGGRGRRGVRGRLGSRWGLRGGRGQGREVGEGREGGEEECHLPRSLPEVCWDQVGGAGWTVEEVPDGVVRRSTFRAQRGGQPIYAVQIVPQGRGEPRPELRKGGPEVAGECLLRGVHWRGRPPEDPVWACSRNCIGYGPPMDVPQRLAVRALRSGTVF